MPLITCVCTCVCIQNSSGLYAYLLSQHFLCTQQATCYAGKCLMLSRVVRNALCPTPRCSTSWQDSPPRLCTHYRWPLSQLQDRAWSHPPPSPPEYHQVLLIHTHTLKLMTVDVNKCFLLVWMCSCSRVNMSDELSRCHCLSSGW